MVSYLSLLDKKKDVITRMYLQEGHHPYHIAKRTGVPLFLITKFLAENGLVDKRKEIKGQDSDNNYKKKEAQKIRSKQDRHYVISKENTEKTIEEKSFRAKHVKYGMISIGDVLFTRDKSKLIVVEVYPYYVVTERIIKRSRFIIDNKIASEKEEIRLRTAYQYSDIDCKMRILV